jgi:hypothetical protein
MVAGVTCWLVGDGHYSGVDERIPENARTTITLFGWPLLIDGGRMLFGRRSFMRYVYRYGLYIALGAVALFLAWWVYDSLSLKAIIAIGLTLTSILLFLILRQLWESSASITFLLGHRRD